MVHIKEIRMTGWKSYGPGTVRMPLAKGFTVIVGPNGEKFSYQAVERAPWKKKAGAK